MDDGTDTSASIKTPSEGCPNCGWAQKLYCLNHVQCMLCGRWQENFPDQGAHLSDEDKMAVFTYSHDGKEVLYP